MGNFEEVFEKAYQESYLPFIEVLQSHPQIKVSLHYSGVLYDWLEKTHPDLLERVAKMVVLGQIEPLTGAYYEPILPLIPDSDKIGQIESFSLRLQERFGRCPRGMWLAERVWEPDLPKPLAQAGIDYTFIDDIHFKAAGLREEELLGYYLTEEEGYLLKLFPISRKLRYLIPFAPKVQEAIDYLRSLATPSGERLIVLGDDGEKFGLWPETYEWVYQKGWLNDFFTALEENRDWIRMWSSEEWMRENESLGRVYLPTSAYQEMAEWALPAKSIPLYEELITRFKNGGELERFEGFLRGGFHRNFLVKYPEANLMHKRMLRVSEKIARLSDEHGGLLMDEAKRLLYQAQCNCAYWHGIFGGLYLPHLRRAVYNRLIEAELITDELSHTKAHWLDKEIADFDRDGNPEILIDSPVINLYLAPHRGGSLFELDCKKRSLNLLDILTRRGEGYHKEIFSLKGEEETQVETKSIHERIKTKEESLEECLIFDQYHRASLIDHFLPPQTTLREFSQLEYEELGDFISEPYAHTMNQEGNSFSVVLVRTGKVKIQGVDLPLLLKKRLKLVEGEALVEIGYELLNLSSMPIEALFGFEFNLSPQIRGGEGPGESKDIDLLKMEDKESGLRVYFRLEQPGSLWQFPIFTVSQSEKGFERILQANNLFFHWHLSFLPNELWRTNLTIEIANAYSF